MPAHTDRVTHATADGAGQDPKLNAVSAGRAQARFVAACWAVESMSKHASLPRPPLILKGPHETAASLSMTLSGT